MCRASALQVCGGGRGSEGEKSSHTTGRQKSAIPFHLLAGVQVKKEEAAFFNHVVDLQEYEIWRYSQIFL